MSKHTCIVASMDEWKKMTQYHRLTRLNNSLNWYVSLLMRCLFVLYVYCVYLSCFLNCVGKLSVQTWNSTPFNILFELFSLFRLSSACNNNCVWHPEKVYKPRVYIIMHPDVYLAPLWVDPSSCKHTLHCQSRHPSVLHINSLTRVRCRILSNHLPIYLNDLNFKIHWHR